MTYGVLFEPVQDPGFAAGYYHAHIPALGLTTHGLRVEGARQAAIDLTTLWLAEKIANGESVPRPGEALFSTLELNANALQGA